MASASTELNVPHEKFEYRETNDPQEIKAQIEETRSKMSTTINAIQYKLSPTHLAGQAKKNIKDVTIGKVEEMAHQASDAAGNWRSGLVNTVRENPIPAAMIGIGLGWLFFNKSGSQDDRDYHYYPTYQEVGSEGNQSRYFDRAGIFAEEDSPEGYRSERIKEGVKDTANRATAKAAGAAEAAQVKAAGAVDQVKESVSQTIGSVGDTVSQAHEATMEHSSQLAQKARDNTYYYSRQAKRTTKDMFYENPLAAGAVALAAGAVVGLLVPTTQKEHEMMGETRDSLLEQAKDKVMETVDKVQDVAGEVKQSAVETAKHEADRKGLTPPQNKVKQT